MSVIDHFNLPVSDLDLSRGLYESALAMLGRRLILQDRNAIGFGVHSWEFGIILAPQPFPAMHVAFCAESRSRVDEFYSAAVRAGALPNGSPGIRELYDPNYYAAYVLDFDGHNVEVVCREPNL